MNKKLFYLPLIFCALAPNCWAPIEQAPPANHVPLHAATPAELAQQQQLQRTQGEVGYVPTDTTDLNSKVTQEVTDHTAGSNLVTAQDEADRRDSDRAKQVLKQAEVGLQQESGHSNGWIWGLIFAALGFGTVAGLRSWAARNIPSGPPSLKPEEQAQTKRQVW